MVDPQIINEWLKKADEDFDFAASVLEDSVFYAQICFHQAAGEKREQVMISWMSRGFTERTLLTLTTRKYRVTRKKRV
jgi:hypothetical protein